MVGIIVHSGEWDKIYHAMSIAALNVAMGEDVVMFFSYWALERLRHPDDVECGDAHKNELIRRALLEGEIKPLEYMAALGRELSEVMDTRSGSFEVMACSGSMQILGISEDELPEWVSSVSELSAFFAKAKPPVIFV